MIRYKGQKNLLKLENLEKHFRHLFNQWLLSTYSDLALFQALGMQQLSRQVWSMLLQTLLGIG